MTATFNLICEKWIPCITSAGKYEEFSLRGLFAMAHEIREISCETPIQSAAMMPLLLAILHRKFGPANTSEWGELWNTGKFDMERLDEYFKEWHERFDLFHPERPFYQMADERVKTGRIQSHLAKTMQDYSVHFTHQTTENAQALPAAEAARVLLQAQAFRLGGGNSGKLSLYNVDSIWARGVVFFARGNNLFETLTLNLIRYPDDSVMPTTDNDKPIWERDDPTEGRSIGKKMLELSPAGYLDYLTWQTNHVQLIPIESENGLMVEKVRVAPVAKFQDGLFYPQHCYLKRRQKDKADKFTFLRFSDDRALWRDYYGLFQRDDNNKLPAVVRWFTRLSQFGKLPENSLLQLTASGLLTAKNIPGKTLFLRQEIMPLPLELLRNEDHARDIRQALNQAEEVADKLRNALNRLAELVLQRGAAGKPDSSARNSLVKQWRARERYWTVLEPRFWRFIEALAADSDAALHDWIADLREQARDALQHAATLAGDSPWALKGEIDAERYLEYQLNDLLNEE